VSFKLTAFLSAAALTLLSAPALADPIRQTKGSFEDKFRQLDEDLPTPSLERPASGKPGPRYWQQKVDYRIEVKLDEKARALSGAARITYTNNSPETLDFLWLHLDQNAFKGSMAELSRTGGGARGRDPVDPGRMSYAEARRFLRMQEFDGGFKIGRVRDASGGDLRYTVVDTLMRVDLPRPLSPGQSVSFGVDWTLNLMETRVVGGRSGYECFTRPQEGGDCIFLAAQWFPRLAAFTDYEGWHNKPFLGSGEFTLEFGDYDVSITAPADHIVSSTGELANPEAVLTAAQRQRLAAARTAKTPTFIVTPAESRANEKDGASAAKTWIFRARNVRDFAFASSRKFIWDAMDAPNPGGPKVLAMSFYPNEAEPLWSAYSTKAIAHTIEVYSRFSFPYPYPTAQSVNGPVGGMEYPMITFNGPRPEIDDKGDRTYSQRTKYGLIGVIIHEIGHIYFPMTVNSDERQWTWMDEGLNTFLQFLAEREWEPDYPASRGDPKSIVEYMRSTDQVPIMTQSDSIARLGDNSYGKPATALVILRETVLGRDLFDFAFKEFAERWKFKRPTPADFFRTMEEASGVDLDWFWRGWFYSTDHVDIAIASVTEGTLTTKDPAVENDLERQERKDAPESLTQRRNRAAGRTTRLEKDQALKDYYNETDEFHVTKKAEETARKEREGLTPEERAVLGAKMNFYRMSFVNEGGLVMPVIVKATYKDGSSETIRIPAEIWRRDPRRALWTHATPKELVSVEIDPDEETADVDRSNNHFPQRIEKTRIELFKDQAAPNRMKDDERVVTPDGLDTAPRPKRAKEEDASKDQR
jgi:hypothetical protein